jgi:chlorobactene glucosyltransferase
MPLWAEVTLFCAYLLVGPLLWGFMIVLMFEGRRRMTALLKAPALTDFSPLVTVLIPARNEAGNIERCLDGVFAQDYPNLRVVVADDRSTDGTGEILDRLADRHENLRVLHLGDADVMPGWHGKSNAMRNLFEKGVRPFDGRDEAVAKSYLLMIDADVRLTRPDAVTVSVLSAVKHKASLFTLLPALESGSFFEGLVIPLVGTVSSTINAVALTNVDAFKHLAYANGQYMMFRRDAYDAVGGHGAVADTPNEDVGLARAVKGSGRRVRVGWGAELCSVRMYHSLGEVYRGLSRILSFSRGRAVWPILAGIAFLVFCGFSAYAAAAYAAYRFAHPLTASGALGWAAACAAHLVAMTIVLGLTYAWSRNPWWNALLFPLGGIVAVAIYMRALKGNVTGTYVWRGVAYQAPQTAKS